MIGATKSNNYPISNQFQPNNYPISNKFQPNNYPPNNFPPQNSINETAEEDVPFFRQYLLYIVLGGILFLMIVIGCAVKRYILSNNDEEQ